MTRPSRNEDIPFSYPVKVGHISANPVDVHVEADAEERAGLARLWNIPEVRSLKAVMSIARWKKDGVRVKGQVTAEIVQSCIVTLEPVDALISESFEQIYVPEGSRLARLTTGEEGEMVLDPEGPDLPEAFTGDSVDAGVTVAECVALAIDPYPRKPGAAFATHIEDDGENDRKPSPFAVLKDWKKD
ncbi:DUF177 domain-containing protein [Rhizobiaceae bacterium BDR2-2]|uniref:DUF177 domain-containing protein n=1 Tax=Ectorhizobium quercum TaxID=2965071 RepID=A0AAE3N1C8_9HYPH|nr:DUF177 domain-containing protein [Ectorhizobium quercum]MCX8998968.1 DUF177 domain-containing protein [Ectorhizobium quercum]